MGKGEREKLGVSFLGCMIGFDYRVRNLGSNCICRERLWVSFRYVEFEVFLKYINEGWRMKMDLVFRRLI